MMRKPALPLLFAFFATVFPTVALASSRVVDLTATDGAKLKATFFSADKPGPGVLLFHQCNKDRKIWDGLAQQLAAAGMNVLTLDNRGFGESGGVAMDKATPQQAQEQQAKWPGDFDLALQYLESQPGVQRDKIGIGGASCGVNNAVQTARRHSEVKSLVLLAGTTDLDGRKFLRNDKTVPIFFAYAADDEFPVSIIAIQWLYSLTGDNNKKLVSYPTGGHAAEIFPVHPELPKAIVDWYVATLSSNGTPSTLAKQSVTVPESVRVLDEIDQPGGAARVAQKVAQSRPEDTKAAPFDEGMVNIIGYEHLQSGDMKGAIEILKLNALAFPNSPNVYDSLSDAYLADGQNQSALENAKKALALLPSDTKDNQQLKDGIKASAEGKVKQLEAGSHN